MNHQEEIYRQLYGELKIEYENLQDKYQQLDNNNTDMSIELEGLKKKIGDFHINESPLGWAIMGSSTHEKMFLAKDKGWDREKIEQIERLLGEG